MILALITLFVITLLGEEGNRKRKTLNEDKKKRIKSDRKGKEYEKIKSKT